MVLVVYFRNFYSRSLVLFPCSISHYHCTRLASTLTLLPLLAIMGNGLVVQVPTSDYAVDLAKPTDGSDIRTISSTTERLATAKMEALRYRKEMYKLVTEEKEGDEDTTEDTNPLQGRRILVLSLQGDILQVVTDPTKPRATFQSICCFDHKLLASYHCYTQSAGTHPASRYGLLAFLGV